MQGHLWVPRMGPRLLRGPFRLPSSHYAGDILISPYPLTSKWLSEYHSSCPSFSSVCMFSHVQLSCDPMDCSLPVHGILQARILEWVAIPFSRGSSQARGWTDVLGLLHCQARSLPVEPPGKPNIIVRRQRARRRKKAGGELCGSVG